MKILLFALLISPAFAKPVAAQQKSVNEAIESVKALIGPLIMPGAKKVSKGAKSFTVAGCEKHKIDWMEVLMMRTKVSISYSFKPQCDIQGTIHPAVLSPFPADLKLRNLEEFTQLKTQNKVSSTIESKPVLHLDVTSGELFGPKGVVRFIANYSVRINPMSDSKKLEENLGGELMISEIYGQKVSIKEKIKVE